ncbi:MAG: hypothetical protein E6I16_12415 [Chloroflexi bacterium]|nr:MAG: hypothetical protein E6I16_12415 [Chloroflexota bacterium]
MPVVQWAVQIGDTVEARDGELGTVSEIFDGPAQSLFLSTDSYMRVVDRGQPDLMIPFTEIVDISDVKRTIYLKRWLREINALGWTRDPRQSGMPAVPFFPKSAAAVKPDSNGSVPPRALVESGAWSPGAAAPRPEPGIPVPGQYMCTVCRFRKHSRQMLEENPDGLFPPAHHPDALWELEDLRS